MSSPYDALIALLRAEGCEHLHNRDDAFRIGASAERVDEACGRADLAMCRRDDDSSHDVCLDTAVQLIHRALRDVEEAEAAGRMLLAASSALEAASQL